MGLRPFMTDTALSHIARTASTTSGPVAAAGVGQHALVMIHCSAASGTTPTLDASLEESADNSTWTAVAGSSITQLTAAGNRIANANVVKNYVRVTVTIGGTTPSFTFSAVVALLPAG